MGCEYDKEQTASGTQIHLKTGREKGKLETIS